VIAALVDNGSSAFKKRSIYNGGKDTVRSNPGVGAIDDTALLKFVGNAIEDIISDVLFVRQNLVNGGARPWAAEIAQYPALIKRKGNFALGLSFLDEHRIDAVNEFDFFWGTGSEDDTVSLEALTITPSEFALRISGFVN
jgi:hypothetical protein